VASGRAPKRLNGSSSGTGGSRAWSCPPPSGCGVLGPATDALHGPADAYRGAYSLTTLTLRPKRKVDGKLWTPDPLAKPLSLCDESHNCCHPFGTGATSATTGRVYSLRKCAKWWTQPCTLQPRPNYWSWPWSLSRYLFLCWSS